MLVKSLKREMVRGKMEEAPQENKVEVEPGKGDDEKEVITEKKRKLN